MTIEAALHTLISPLCARVYPDTAPLDTVLPYVVWVQVGGDAINPVNGGAVNLRWGRIQVNVWAATRIAANTLMRQIEDALRDTPTFAVVEGALISRYEDGPPALYGAQQDFTIAWSA